MSADAFRDAIAGVAFADRWRSDCGEGTADAILAMPEMEAIRIHLYLNHAIATWGQPRDPALVRRIMAGCGLPESVIGWVLGGPA